MRMIGRYTLIGLLGKGGMSTVYKVAMPVTDKIVALKLFNPPELLIDIVGEKELRRLFTAEAVTMARLRHPHIVDVWDFDHHDGRPFFIMEYFCNNLGHMIGEGDDPSQPGRSIDAERVFNYGEQLLDGLSCLHQAGIIHRDIKPYNLLITDQDTVKIADFGLSKLHGENLPAQQSIRIGSPFYAAPEQEKDPENVDERADLYAAGVTLFRLLHGMMPNASRTITTTSDTEELFLPWREFFKQAMSPNRKDRHHSATVMLGELLQIKKQWLQQRSDYCRIFAPTFDEEQPPDVLIRLRSEPIIITPSKAKSFFKVDPLWRPKRFITNDFHDNNDGTIRDSSTGLTWQQKGSEFPMTWPQSLDYVDALNLNNWSGRNRWRLPTVDELLSLLDIPDDTKYCRQSLFSQKQKWLWSKDCLSSRASWYMNMEMGCLAWQDHSCCYFVRAVHTDNP